MNLFNINNPIQSKTMNMNAVGKNQPVIRTIRAVSKISSPFFVITSSENKPRNKSCTSSTMTMHPMSNLTSYTENTFIQSVLLTPHSWLRIYFFKMESSMLGNIYNFKIAESVISSYVIFMMNLLYFHKLSSKVLFHYVSML